MTKLDPDQLGELLSAYVDRELDSAQTAHVEQLLREDATARRMLADLRRTVNAVASLPRHPAPTAIAADVQAALERSALLDDAPVTRPHAHRTRAPWTAKLSMAAMLAVVVGVGWWFLQDRSVSTKKQPADVFTNVEGKLTDSATPAPPAPEFDKVTARLATFDEKLAAAADVRELKNHAFAAESVRVQVSVRDLAEREEVANRVTQRLADQRVPNLAADKPPATQIPQEQALFYRGESGVNYAPSNQAQILVRATPKQIDEVLAEVERNPSTAKAAELQMGTLNVKGMAKSRAIIQSLGQKEGPQKVVQFAPYSEPADPTVPVTPSSEWVDGILRIIGVPPGAIAPPEEATDVKDAVAQSTITDEGRADEASASPSAAGARGEYAETGATRGPTEAERDKSEASSKRAAPAVPADRPGLVEERLNELNRAAAPKSKETPPEQLVTLVIELIPPQEAAPPRSSPDTKPPVRSRASEGHEKR